MAIKNAVSEDIAFFLCLFAGAYGQQTPHGFLQYAAGAGDIDPFPAAATGAEYRAFLEIESRFLLQTLFLFGVTFEICTEVYPHQVSAFAGCDDGFGQMFPQKPFHISDIVIQIGAASIQPVCAFCISGNGGVPRQGHDAVYGKMLKKPEDYTDVRGQVTADLQDEMERFWVADLRKKYPVTINENVLKTVNKHE